MTSDLNLLKKLSWTLTCLGMKHGLQQIFNPIPQLLDFSQLSMSVIGRQYAYLCARAGGMEEHHNNVTREIVWDLNN